MACEVTVTTQDWEKQETVQFFSGIDKPIECHGVRCSVHAADYVYISSVSIFCKSYNKIVRIWNAEQYASWRIYFERWHIVETKCYSTQKLAIFSDQKCRLYRSVSVFTLEENLMAWNWIKTGLKHIGAAGIILQPCNFGRNYPFSLCVCLLCNNKELQVPLSY